MRQIVPLLLVCLCVRPALASDPVTSRPSQPFKGAYLHLDHVLSKNPDRQARREALAKALDRFKSAGLRVAMPYVKGTSGAAAYESNLVPLRQYQDWDALADFMGAARERDLEVWPVICVVPSGHEKPRGILEQHPEWALRDKNGKPAGYVSPCNPKAREWMAAMVAEVVGRYRPEGVLLDYLRFASQAPRLDPEGTAAFEKQFPLAASATEAERKTALQAFKEASLTELARMTREAVRKERPQTRIGLYTWGPQVTAGHSIAQRWDIWLARGYLDMVNVSGYCYTDNFGPDYLKTFETRMRDAHQLWKRAGGKAQLSFAVGVKTSHGQVHSAREIGEYLKIARQAGVPGFAFFTWSYLQPYLDDVVVAGYLDAR